MVVAVGSVGRGWEWESPKNAFLFPEFPQISLLSRFTPSLMLVEGEVRSDYFGHSPLVLASDQLIMDSLFQAPQVGEI